MAGVSRSRKFFTAKQGQYLAYIHLYTRLHRRPPAETDMQEYFRVSPPSVHQMVLTLERAGFIRRQPRTPRSIELLVDPTQLPDHSDPRLNRSKSPCRATSSEEQLKDVHEAARAVDRQIHILHASSEPELDTAFATLPSLRAGALLVGSDPYFNSRREQI